MEHSAWLVDLDGTLYFPKPVKLLSGLELFTLGYGAVRFVQAFRKQHEVLRKEEAYSEHGAYQLQLDRAAKDLGVSPDAIEPVVSEWMQKRPAKWIRRFRRTGLLNEIEGYRSQGGRCALVTDYPARIKLAALGAEHLFDEVVANGEPGGPKRLKPAPDGYLAAAERLGVRPDQCLVVGDRDDADGEAARRAKMTFRLIR